MVTIRKRWTFDAAHQLYDHDGKCARPHGHTYSVEVAVQGKPQPVDGRSSGGMVCDFAELDASWQAIKNDFDHQDLNVTLQYEVPATTSEHLAVWLLGYFTESLGNAPCKVQSVTVSETAATSATATS